jgi:hypothetical protein
MSKTNWNEENVSKLKKYVEDGNKLEWVGRKFGVSKQRIYQVMQRHNITTNKRKVKTMYSDSEHPERLMWLNRKLASEGVSAKDRKEWLAIIDCPDRCPVFGFEMNYLNSDPGRGRDYGPSLDRIDSNKGYELHNVQVISWRANRIKNDSTPEELRMLADYMEKKQGKSTRQFFS